MNKKLQNILLVEDEIDIQTVAKMALETVGEYHVDTCNSGKDALEYLKNNKTDLILLDVMMPIMGGKETIKILKISSETKDIPVIFMTAKVQTKEVTEYHSLGAIGVIPKPFDPMELSDVIKSVWNKANLN